MKTFATATAALFLLSSAGLALAQNNNDGTAGNGGATGSSNCPDDFQAMSQDQLSEKCKAELSELEKSKGMSDGMDATGSTTDAPGAAVNSVEQPPEGSNSSSTSQ